MTDINLFIATPCYDGNVSSGYVMSILALQRLLMQNRVGHDICLHSDSLITRARNRIAANFLHQPEYTHLLFIDADIVFDAGTVLRYLAFNKDLVAGIYPIKNLNLQELRRSPIDDDRAAEAASYSYSSAVNLDHGEPSTDGFVQVEYAAGGFMMIRRHALEAMAAHYPELRYKEDFTGSEAAESYAFFDTLIHAGRFLPEDYSFCRRWRNMGGEVWGDLLSRFDHIGKFVYSGHVAALALKTIKPRKENSD